MEVSRFRSKAVLLQSTVAPMQAQLELPVTEVYNPRRNYLLLISISRASGAAGSATISARSPRFTDGTTAVQVVQPVFRIYNLSTSTTTLSADNEFYVNTGVLNTAGTGSGSGRK